MSSRLCVRCEEPMRTVRDGWTMRRTGHCRKCLEEVIDGPERPTLRPREEEDDAYIVCPYCGESKRPEEAGDHDSGDRTCYTCGRVFACEVEEYTITNFSTKPKEG